MNYELAKQLKDAGFPFENRCEYANEAYEDGLGKCAYCGTATLGHGSHSSLLPTLSELIEACGEKFDALMRLPAEYTDGEGEKWVCTDSYGGSVAPKGSTPEEAVARLWLALNKKI